MKIKRISKLNLTSILIASTLITTPLAFIPNSSNQSVMQEKASNQSSRSVPTVSALDVTKNSTWSESIYSTTNGLYVYGDDDTIPRNRWLYQINKDGLQVNTTYPQYNKIQSILLSGIETTLPDFTLAQAGVSSYTQYANGEYTNTSGDTNYQMNFEVGGSDFNKLSATNKNFKTSYEQPFFKIDLLRWEWAYKLLAETTYRQFTDTNMQHMVTSVNSFNAWSGKFADYQPYALNNTNAVTAVASKAEMDFQVTSSINQISVFNEYDLNGQYINTYMYPDGAVGINSVFDVIVDESLLDKSLPPASNDLSGLKDMVSLNLTNVPNNFAKNMRIEAITDNNDGSIAFNLYSKYLVNNGEIILNSNADTPVATFVSTGFLKTNTSITQLLNPPIISVDAFIDAVAPGGVVNRVELAKYLDLTTVPADANINITVTEAANIQTGKIKVRILIDKYLDLNNAVVNGDAKFNLELELSPRITIFTVLNNSMNVAIDQVIPALFDTTGTATSTFVTHFKFDIIPADSKITLKTNSVQYDLGNGLISFDVMASSYYNSNAQLSSNGSFSVKNFKAFAPLTTFSYVNNYAKNIRADEFLKSVADTTGVLADRYLVNNLTLLKKYIHFNAAPNGDVFIKKEPVVDKTAGSITFKIILANANDGSGAIVNNFESQELTLHLLATPATTMFTVKSSYDKKINVERFLVYLVPNGVLDETYLKTFVDYSGDLPKDSVISIDPNYTFDNKLGTITFDIVASKYYDANSVLSTNGKFTINLTLAPKYNPTKVTLKADYDNTLKPAAFLEYILPGGTLNKAKLFEFIDINQEDPENQIGVEFDKLNTAVSSEANAVELGLILTNWYNEESILVKKPTLFSTRIQFAAPKKRTTLRLLTNYNKNVTLDQFIAATLANGKAVKSQIQKYVLIENFPSANEIAMLIDSYDETSGQVKFTLSGIGQDTNGNAMSFRQQFTINILRVIDGKPQVPYKTEVKNLSMPNNGLYSSDFVNKILVNETLNYGLLSTYVDLSTMPIDADVSIKDNKINVNENAHNEISFILNYNKSFSGMSANPINGAYEYEVKLVFPMKRQPTTITSLNTVAWEYTIDDLWLAITTKNVLDMNKLAQFIDLSSLPPETTVVSSYTTLAKDTKTANLSLVLTVSKYYDEEGNLFEGNKNYTVHFNAVAAVNKSTEINDLLWLWVSLGLVGLLIIISVILLLRRRKSAKNFYDFKKDQY